MRSGEFILSWVLALCQMASDMLFGTYLFTMNGHGVSLGNFVVWCIGFSIVVDIFAILNGGEVGDDWEDDAIDSDERYWE